MQPALSPGQEIALRRRTIEDAAKALTRTQADALRRIKDKGPLAWCFGVGRAGGAVSRMFDRMAADCLCTRAPHDITKFGREVLIEKDRAKR